MQFSMSRRGTIVRREQDKSDREDGGTRFEGAVRDLLPRIIHEPVAIRCNFQPRLKLRADYPKRRVMRMNMDWTRPACFVGGITHAGSVQYE